MIPNGWKSCYYNKKGEKIDAQEWERLSAQDPNYRIVKQENIGDFYVSTVWLGLDHNLFNRVSGNETDISIFETMIFPKDKWGELYLQRYSTEEEALAGHQVAVEEAKKMNNKKEVNNESDSVSLMHNT